MKSLLKPHFSIEWPVSDKNAESEFLALFTSTLQTLSTRRTTTKGQKKKKRTNRKRSNKEKKETTDAGCSESGAPPSKRIRVSEPKSDQCEVAASSSSPSKCKLQNAQWKHEFVVGMSAVLRCLEKRQLRLVLFDRDAVCPSAVGMFVGAAAAGSGASCYAITGLSASCRSIMNLHSLRAIGIKHPENPENPETNMEELIARAADKLKPVIYCRNYMSGDNYSNAKVSLFKGPFRQKRK